MIREDETTIMDPTLLQNASGIIPVVEVVEVTVSCRAMASSGKPLAPRN